MIDDLIANATILTKVMGNAKRTDQDMSEKIDQYLEIIQLAAVTVAQEMQKNPPEVSEVQRSNMLEIIHTVLTHVDIIEGDTMEALGECWEILNLRQNLTASVNYYRNRIGETVKNASGFPHFTHTPESCLHLLRWNADEETLFKNLCFTHLSLRINPEWSWEWMARLREMLQKLSDQIEAGATEQSPGVVPVRLREQVEKIYTTLRVLEKNTAWA